MAHDDLTGRVIDGRYRVGDVIGEGAMGIVYRCRHTRLDRDVAIKILRRERGQSEDLVRRFVKEARLASSIKHPNVVDLSDSGELEEGGAYYVMEMLEGEALAETLARERRVAPRSAFDIVFQICAGLQAAHALEIVHRDLKPENVFLCDIGEATPRVKLLDFGIARAKNSKDTLPGAVLGTPEYMAPEQAMGSAVDPRADLYALGVMLFELLSGRVPLYAEDLGELLRLKLHAPPLRLCQAAPDLANMRATDALIGRLLEREPAARVQTIAETIRLLHEAQAADLDGSGGGARYTQGIGSGDVDAPSPNTAYDRAVGGAWQRPGTKLPSVGEAPPAKGFTVPATAEAHAAAMLVRDPQGAPAPALAAPNAAVPPSSPSVPIVVSSSASVPVVVSSSASVPIVTAPSGAQPRVPWDEGESTKPGRLPARALAQPAPTRSVLAIPLLAMGAAGAGALIAALLIFRPGGESVEPASAAPGEPTPAATPPAAVGTPPAAVGTPPAAVGTPPSQPPPAVEPSVATPTPAPTPVEPSVPAPATTDPPEGVVEGTDAKPVPAVPEPSSAKSPRRGRTPRPRDDTERPPTKRTPADDKGAQPSKGDEQLDLVDPFGS